MLRMGEKYEVLATNTMTDQIFIATPAITGGEMFSGANPGCTAFAKTDKKRCQEIVIGRAYAAVLVRACNELDRRPTPLNSR